MNTPLKAVFLLGTLKSPSEISHTEVLCEVLVDQLKERNTESEIIRLIEYDIKPGTKTDMGGDDWPGVLERVLKADIIIFATPIWWGIASSLTQRVIERMDELNDKLLETGQSEFDNKVGGIVITGAEDGVQHIIGNLCDFMIWNGLTIPPAASLTWLGDASKEGHDSLKKKFEESKSTASMAKVMATNLTFMARLLKEHPYPHNEGGILQDIAPGTVGMNG
jgi:multimeric flavodoxin WrbA